MKKAWFSTKELIGIASLPGTRQGVTDRSRREHWIKRPQRGVQGNGFEFALESLPLDVQRALTGRQMLEPSVAPYAVITPGVEQGYDAYDAVNAFFRQMSPEQCKLAVKAMMSMGIDKFMICLGVCPDDVGQAEKGK